MGRNEELLKQLAEADLLCSIDKQIGEAIKSVIMSKLLYMTKDNKFISYTAEELIRELSEYAVYCKDDKQEEWKDLVRTIIYASGQGNDQRVFFELGSFRNAGVIMKMQAEGCSFDEMHTYFFDNVCEGGTEQLLFGLKMIEFSKDGKRFIEEHYSDKLPSKRTLLNKLIDDAQR